MMCLRKMLSAGFSALLALTAFTADPELYKLSPSIAIGPYAQQTTDGKRTAEEDAGCMGMWGFCDLHTAKILPAEAKLNIGTDGKTLFLSAICETGDMGILQRSKKGLGGERAFLDDSFEFILIPNPENKDNPIVYHLFLNNKGSYMCMAKNGSAGIGWEPDFTCKGTVKDKQWTFEVALPLAQFGLADWQDGKTIGFRFCRNWRRLTTKFGGDWGKQSSWNQKYAGFFTPVNIPLITLTKNAPVVRQLPVYKNGKADPKISIMNPTTAPMELQVASQVQPATSQPSEKTETITLAPGETKIVDIPAAQVFSEEEARTAIRVADASGKTVYFFRAFRWQINQPAMFQTGGKDALKLVLNYAYFPEQDTIYAVADTSALQDPKQVKSIKLTVADKAGKTIAETVMPAGKDNSYTIFWKIPSLKEITKNSNPSGEYTLTLVADGIANGKIVKTFERKLFEWEGNQLGKSDILIKPYTAIQVKGNTVSTILRDHKMNGLGLWDQVRSEGKDIFTKGMSIVAVIDGKTYEAKGDDLEFVKKTPTKVIIKAKWNAGALKAEAVCDWDYDGMMKYTMTLDKTPGTVDSLKLVISLDPKYAYLFHETADGLRFNYGGKLLDKWESKQASKAGIRTSFVPYFWAGSETRGMSVFGNSDRGWVPDKNVSAQVVEKKDGVVEMTLNLFAKPYQIKEPRTIIIGFQATPVKPMPEDWRLIAFNFSFNTKPYFKQFLMLLGCDYCYGGIGNSNDFFPRDFDMSLWETMKCRRETGKDAEGFTFKKWMDGYRYEGAFATHDPKGLAREVAYGLHTVKEAGLKYPVIAYLNPRGTRTDLAGALTFQDSWFMDQFQPSREKKPEYGSCHTYGVDPCETYRDFALFWYDKMLTMRVTDKLYWDNTYLYCNSNRVGTEGYELEDGSGYQCSVGLWNMRELIRRSAIHMVEMGKDPLNVIHMTNTAIMPVAAFAQCNYDWEDEGGERPFQQRYTKEYVRAVSLGRQSGNRQFVMGPYSSNDPEKRKLLGRSKTGVTMTHENSGMPVECYKFGYGKPEVRVWNYWDEDYPVKVSGDTTSILMTKTGAAQMAVCNYSGEAADFTAEIDLKKAGLSGTITAKDVQTGKELKVEGNKIFFHLPGYDYVYMEITVK